MQFKAKLLSMTCFASLCCSKSLFPLSFISSLYYMKQCIDYQISQDKLHLTRGQYQCFLMDKYRHVQTTQHVTAANEMHEHQVQKKS